MGAWVVVGVGGEDWVTEFWRGVVGWGIGIRENGG